MAREYARVKVKIWSDGDFRLLSRAAQGLYFTLITSPTMNLCGVADWRPNRLAALTAGETRDSVMAAGDELAGAAYIVVDEETEEVLVRSFVRHDGLIKTPNIASAMAKDYAGVASETLRGVVVHELQRLHIDEPEMKGWSVAGKLLSDRAVDPTSIPSRNPSAKASGNPSVMGSGMAYPMGSGNGSHIPQPSSRNQQPSSLIPAPVAEPTGFDEFWAAYPKRADKGHARTAWAKAVRKADVEVIVEGARRFANDPHLPEPKFIPLAATWLNGERWSDDPLPPRPTGGHGGSPTDSARDVLELGRRLAEGG